MLRHPIKIEAASPLAKRLVKLINERVARSPYCYQRLDYADLAREADAPLEDVAAILEPIANDRDGLNIAKQFDSR